MIRYPKILFVRRINQLTPGSSLSFVAYLNSFEARSTAIILPATITLKSSHIFYFVFKSKHLEVIIYIPYHNLVDPPRKLHLDSKFFFSN
jgi:hypothetical protein